MYNTKYKCIKSFYVYDSQTQKPIKIERRSIWQLAWCGGERSFKELKSRKMVISLPDEYVERYFKKI